MFKNLTPKYFDENKSSITGAFTVKGTIVIDYKYLEEKHQKYGKVGLFLTDKSEVHFKNGKLHRLDGPAVTIYSSENQLHKQYWFNNGKLHRKDGPAKVINYEKNGRIKCEKYAIRGRLHRENAPAKIEYRLDGSKAKESFFSHGYEHRTTGPAVITHLLKGPSEEWFIKGEKLSPEEVEKYLIRLELSEKLKELE